MKKILLFACALVLLAGAHSCKTTTAQIITHDTLTVTRDSLVYIHTRDTLTITQDRDRDVIKYVYDTAQRVREVVKIQYRDRYKAEQGNTQTIVQHDTITVQSGQSVTQAKTTKPAKVVSFWNYAFFAALLGAFLFVYFRFGRKK